MHGGEIICGIFGIFMDGMTGVGLGVRGVLSGDKVRFKDYVLH